MRNGDISVSRKALIFKMSVSKNSFLVCQPHILAFIRWVKIILKESQQYIIRNLKFNILHSNIYFIFLLFDHFTPMFCASDYSCCGTVRVIPRRLCSPCATTRRSSTSRFYRSVTSHCRKCLMVTGKI